MTSPRLFWGALARRALALVALIALITAVHPPATAYAADCTIAQLEPTLAEATVTQGVGSATRLTRGKETIVQLFLTRPPAAVCTVTKQQSVSLTGASLAVSTGTSPNTLFTGLAAPVVLPATIQASTTSPDPHPVFVVPGANVAPAAGDAEFTPTFTATITYSRKSGTTVQSGLTKTFTFSKTFERKTNALRVLLIPMGDRSQPYSTQYTSQDQTIVQNAMQTLSRIFPNPVAVNVLNDLATDTGGVRYLVDTAMMLDLRSINGAYVTLSGATKFCGTGANFTAIKGLLANALVNHNSLNPSRTADRVVGVVGGNGAAGGPISFGTEASAGCADGMASVSSAESWIRLIPDQPAAGGQPAKPSRSGAILAMEVAHTFGLDETPSYHASAIDADGGTDRAYNVTTRSRIAADHNVMNFNNTGSFWDNTTTLLDAADYGKLLCKLSPTATAGCPAPGNVGTATGVASGQKYVIAGTTDGTPANTIVVEPYYTDNSAEIVDDASLLRVVQIDPATSSVVFNAGIPWAHAITHGADSAIQTFRGAVPGFSAAAGEVRLVKVGSAGADPLGSGAVTLFSTTEIAPPTVASVSSAIPPSGGTTTIVRNQITPAIPPKPDVVFLADTTGSMGPALNNVRLNAASIMSQVRQAQPQAMFAAASFKDEPAFCDTDPYVFRIEQALTTDASAVEAAITPNPDVAHSGWQTAPGQGCDRDESQLNALWQLAQRNPDTGAYFVGFRSDSTRIIAWFGDAPGHDPSQGHTLAQVIASLQNEGIRVVAVNMQAEGSSLDATGQGTAITQATGGALVQNNDASQVSAAILAGLQNVRVTVTPEVNTASCSDRLGVAFTPASRTVESGSTADFTETVTVAAGTAAGTYTCQVFFKVDGKIVTRLEGETSVPDPAYIQTISITVSSAQQETMTVRGMSPQPQRLLLDIVLRCRDINFLAVMALPPSAVQGEEATFNANVDRTAACANFGGGGTTIAYLSDGWNRVGGAVTAPTPSAPKPPTAAITSPPVGSAIEWDGTVPLRGSGHVAGIELPASALSWSLTSPSGVTTSVGSGYAVDVKAPVPNGWAQGTWTARLTVTSDSGTATATTTFGTRFQFIGFYDPVANPPEVNTGNTGKSFPLKWSLRSGGTDVSALSAVASTLFGQIATCGGPVDPSRLARTSGQSTLRYDAAAKQYLFNWQTPTQPGLYLFRLTLSDGSTHDACVNLAR